jgi:hypothetical protein
MYMVVMDKCRLHRNDAKTQIGEKKVGSVYGLVNIVTKCHVYSIKQLKNSK